MPERIEIASLGPTPETAISRSKRACSVVGQEAEERERVLAHVGVGEQRDVAARVADAIEGAEGDRDAIADARHVDDDLLRLLPEQPAAKLSDHVDASE